MNRGSLSMSRHLVIVIPQCAGRTIASNAIRRASELTTRFTVTMISDRFPDSFPAGLERVLIRPRRYDYLRRFCHIPNELAFARAARAAVAGLGRRADFLICHGHTVAFFVGRYFQAKGIPYALLMHGDIYDRPLSTYGFMLTAYYRAITPMATRSADLVIAQSPDQKRLAERHGPLRGHVCVVPNGIDRSSIGLLPGQRNDKVSQFRTGQLVDLLYVGNRTAEKGFDTLLDACAMLRMRKFDFRLTVIGPDPLPAAVNTRFPDGEVRYIGNLDRAQLGSHYLDAHLLCVPSLSEPLANVVLEALVAGTPVLATTVGGNTFMIRHGANGLLVEPGSAHAFASAITELSADPDRMRRLAANAVESVEQRFTWQSAGRTLIQHIERVLVGEPAGRGSDPLSVV